MATNQQQTTNRQSRPQQTNVGETSQTVTGQTSAPPTQAYRRQFLGQGQPNYHQTGQGQTKQSQPQNVSRTNQKERDPVLGPFSAGKIQTGGAIWAGGLTQRQLESLEMSLMEKEDEKMGVGKTTDRLVQNDLEINYEENQNEWSCTIYFPNLKYRLPNGLDWSKTSDGGFIVTSEETSSIPVDIPSYINPDHVEVIESQGTAELLFCCELIPPEHEVDSGNSGQGGSKQPMVNDQNEVSNGPRQNAADLAELLDTIPSEARFGDIIEEENMQFVEKCDDNVWEAILVRNDMNMDQATFERDETGGWGVYDGSRFHPISIPEDVEPKHVVVMPEGKNRIRIFGLLQSPYSFTLSEFKEYILYRRNLAAAGRKERPPVPYPNWEPRTSKAVARRPEGTFGVNNKSDKLRTMPEFYGFHPKDPDRQPRTTRDTLEDDFVEFLERSDGQLWEGRLTHSGMDMNNITVEKFAFTIPQSCLVQSRTGKKCRFAVPNEVSCMDLKFQRHGPSTLLIFGNISAEVPTQNQLEKAIQNQSLNLSWKSDQPLSATVDDQLKLLGPVKPGYTSKFKKVYSKAPTQPKYPEALVRIDENSNESLWEIIVCCTLFNHDGVSLVRIEEEVSDSFFIRDSKHDFLVKIEVPFGTDPDTVEMLPKEETPNRLHRIIRGSAHFGDTGGPFFFG
ncbi:uncharacterized protein LOC142351492 isoform X2 [Convolutriloba macropyga]|uniref:uncharacterized protein LOC142351492 isoform X2 n=1 Tax=Convolutriloba macropyga TaxID=536237 RepID=UPI003F5285C3